MISKQAPVNLCTCALVNLLSFRYSTFILKGFTFFVLFSIAVFVSEPVLTYAKTPNDTFYGEQWYLQAIGAEAAWDITTGSRNVVVAVVDTAVDIDHEDLKPNIWVNTGEIFGNGIDDDSNGFIDDTNGWNFERDSWDVRPNTSGGDELGYVHGTLVASLIGARGNNGLGISGVAWDVQIMPVVALDADGNGHTTDVANAIRYAVDNGAHIINLSLEGYGSVPSVEDALAYAQQHGVLTVAAAGNADEEEGADLDLENVFPACLSNQVEYGVFGVGSLDRDNRKAPYANYGSCILASAPGSDIFGARPTVTRSGEETAIIPGYDGGWSGTSLATPLVSGAAALIKSLRPDWGWAEIREGILSSATPIDHLQDPLFRTRIGRGALNIGTAVANVPSLIQPPAPETDDRTPAPSTSPQSTVDPRALAAMQLLIAEIPNTVHVFVGTGIVVAESVGGRAWGIASDGTLTLFHPYGTTYMAGLDVVAIPGGVAFAPRGGGGHLMVTDTIGRRLVSVFPFGKDARGRWSVAVLPASVSAPAELVMSGPLGSRAIPLDRIGAEGWRTISLAELEARFLQ